MPQITAGRKAINQPSQRLTYGGRFLLAIVDFISHSHHIVDITGNLLTDHALLFVGDSTQHR